MMNFNELSRVSLHVFLTEVTINKTLYTTRQQQERYNKILVSLDIY